METKQQGTNSQFRHFLYIVIIIAVGMLSGIVLTLFSGKWPPGSAEHNLLLNIGSGLMATAFISLILELVWSKQRTQAEKDELQPIYDKLKEVPDKLGKLEGRLEAFKQLGFNNCYASRSEALQNFLSYAQEIITEGLGIEKESERLLQNTIDLVSSSARGLMGYIDRDPSQIQRAWRDLITKYPRRFRILLTHPAFAHLRQPAEERALGDIELEILKTAIYLHCVAGMKSSELRLYRGSPTVFAIQAGEHILVNPYPYGKMAMDTLCLEFERGKEGSYIANFMSMHFNHTWAFIDQPSKVVDGKPLVVGIEKFDDILQAFSECTFLNAPRRLRLTEVQVIELDTFTCETLRKMIREFAIEPPSEAPFVNFVRTDGLVCSDQISVNSPRLEPQPDPTGV
jgi:hypothetical protein